jgi:hypothetical protein
MPNRLVIGLVMSGLFIGSLRSSNAEELIARFYDMSDTRFSVEAVSPKDVIREFAICKAVWFAEKKDARSISLSDPVYSKTRSGPAHPIQVPDDWVAVNATAYLTDPNPSGNPTVSVAEKAAQCRRVWDWYR